MKIAYTNKRLFTNLIIGIVWIGLGIFYLFEDKNSDRIPYLTIAVGTLFLLIFIYEYFGRYIKITEAKITVNDIPKKHILISELTWVDRQADDYIFRSSDKILKISRSLINKKDLPRFESFFNELGISIKSDK
ncbi:hypothetical protein HNP38_002292 [Chryseobacterium defluvii]|uniref:PH (Pleckstrin Homology) domain-containing protein n=1 Tax=Chryseobacterium defluvii TaxID=160396 RepID=A0A840KCU2_9FLAO|nr:hypothetical protein [Chryseobacterium defluvii]MBB4806996.1 hypothetical protein [Chryseobacterium defluvii]